MKRFGLTHLCLLTIWAVADVADARAEIPACQLGLELRQALGFGCREMAALGVTGTAYGEIVSVANTYCDQNRETVEPLLAALRTARQDAQAAYETGEATSGDDEAVLTALGNIATAASTVAESMRSHLSEGQQPKQLRIAANAGLDTRFVMLDLATEQRSALRTAQRARDLVLMNLKDRKRSLSVQAAVQGFAEAAQFVLDSEQESDAAAFAESLDEHDAALREIDQQSCQQEE